MKAVTTSIFGPVHLRLLGPRSSILDFWLAELKPERETRDGVGLPCMLRRMLHPYAAAHDLMQVYYERTREVMAFSHPAVQLPLTILIEQGTLYTLFDVCTGWNLSDLLQDWQERQVVVPLDGVLQLFFPLAHALACAHARPEKPLVHGAIRPVSIWIEADGKPKLGDFDVGALAEYDLKGSSVYESTGMRACAPEREKDWAAPPVGTDSFSFAATLLEVLSAGRLSRVQNSAVLRDRLTLLMTQGVPAELLKLLASCHNDEPAERPPMKDVAEALKDMLGRVPRSQRFSEFLAANALPQPTLPAPPAPELLARQLERFPRYELEPESKRRVEALAPAKQGTGGGGGGLRLLLVILFALGLAGAGIQLAMPGLIPSLLGSGGPVVAVTVESVPSGASITLESGAVLGVAPLRIPLTVPASGLLRLTASSEGFTPETQEKTTTGGGPVAFQFALKPVDPSSGMLMVSSVPEGATIMLDGKPVGVTPRTLTGLSAKKDHLVVVSLDGYRREQRTVSLKAGSVEDLAVQLKARPEGGAEAESESDGRPSEASGTAKAPSAQTQKESAGLIVASTQLARLKIDGMASGTTSSERVIRLSPGPHRIEIEDATFAEPVVLDASLPSGETAVYEYDAARGAWKMGSRPDPVAAPETSPAP